MVEYIYFLVPLPEGEHKVAADKAPGGDNKDAADEKMEGKWNRKCIGLWTLGLIVVHCHRGLIFSLHTQEVKAPACKIVLLLRHKAHFAFPIRPLGVKAFYGKN